MINQNYCPRIFHGLTLEASADKLTQYSVCCWASTSIKDKGPLNFEHKELVDLRSQNKQGSLPYSYCSVCMDQEKAGKKSMRLGYVEMHGEESYEPILQYLDIQLDMTCNLACVTCGPALSTTWRKELKIKNLQVRPNIENFLTENLTTLDFSQLREIRIWGGEPFLTHTHLAILKFISSRVDVSDVKLMYNTNGTCLIDSETKRCIEKFKFARISFSIDAVGDKFDYLRYPAKWSEVEKNLLWWRENLPHNSMLSLTVTASVLNVLYLDEIFDWCSKHFTKTKFGDPIEIFVHAAFGDYALENMPTEMVEYLKSIKNYCQPWIQKLPPSVSPNIDNIKNKLQELENRRGNSVAQVLPLTAKFLNFN